MSLSQNHHRVWSPTHRRVVKEERKAANRDRVDHQACSMLQYIDVIANLLIMGNYSNELRRKLLEPTIFFNLYTKPPKNSGSESMALERFKSVNLNKKLNYENTSISRWQVNLSVEKRPPKTQRRAEYGIRLSDHNVKKQSQHKQYNCPCNVYFYLGNSAGYSVASYLDLAMHHSKFRSRNDWTCSSRALNLWFRYFPSNRLWFN